MQSDIQAPRPLRSLKRLPEDAPDCQPASKHARLSPFPSPISIDDLPSRYPSSPLLRPKSESCLQRTLEYLSNHSPLSKHPQLLDRLSEVPHSSSYLSRALSRPSSARRRNRGEPDPDCAPASKHCRLQSPPSSPPSLSAFLPASVPIQTWLSEVPCSSSYLSKRPCSAPPDFSGRDQLASTNQRAFQPTSLVAISQMSQQNAQNLRTGSIPSSQSERPSTSSPIYRSTLSRNRIVIDNTGRQVSSAIKDLVETHIRKRRSSPRLEQEERFGVVDKVVKLWDKAEPTVSDITKTLAFPIERPGLAEGRDTTWSTKPLPTNPRYSYGLPAPKPDRHYGYPTGQESEWTDEEIAVVDHRVARPYTQPTRENLFPFLMIEVKSEATGGTLYTAESQAAVSGAHSVHALRWLLSQACPSRTLSSTDSVVFTAAVSQRIVVFHVIWYSSENGSIYMSHIDTLAFMKESDIQECSDLIKNIVDYGLKIRQPIIRDALKALHPIPQQWKKARPANAIEDTAEPFNSDDGRSSKTRRT